MGPLASFQQAVSPDGRPVWAIGFQMAHNLPAYTFTFACGIAAAKVFVEFRLGRSRWITSAGNATIVLVLAVVALLWLMWKMGSNSIAGGFTTAEPLITGESPGSTFYYYMESIPFGALYALVVLGVAFGYPVVRAALSPRILTIFGVAGYGYYLMHMPILRNIAFLPSIYAMPEFTKFAATVFLAGSLTLFASYWFHRMVELPFIARGRGDVQPEPMFATGR
jgi:peptidoglycan/LPS O-acetylase OafA/YrhL